MEARRGMTRAGDPQSSVDSIGAREPRIVGSKLPVKTFARVLLAACCAAVVLPAWPLDPPASASTPGTLPPAPAATTAVPASSPTPAKPEPDAKATGASSATTTSAEASAAAAKPTRIVLGDKTLTQNEVKQLLAQGYKPVSRGGEIYYCRRETQLGSRFTNLNCRTGQRVKERTQDSQDMLSNHPGNPPMPLPALQLEQFGGR